MRRATDIGGLAAAVAGTAAVGGLSALLAGGDLVACSGSLRKPPGTLRKPPGTPPPGVFGPARGTPYLLMGVAARLVWREGLTRQTALALGLSAAQLVLDFAWSPVFFGQQRLGAALPESAVLWLIVLLTIAAFRRARRAAGALPAPYLARVSFATYLNAGVWRLNAAVAPA
jgi:tryptophan-rich sensory protein